MGFLCLHLLMHLYYFVLFLHFGILINLLVVNLSPFMSFGVDKRVRPSSLYVQVPLNALNLKK